MAEMSDDDTPVVQLGKILRDYVSHIVIAEPMKSIPANPFVTKLAPECEGVVHPRVSTMKGRVKTRHVDGIGKEIESGANTSKIMRLVQWGQRAEGGEGRLDLGREHNGRCQAWPAMYNAMSDSRDLAARAYVARALS